MKHLSVLTVAVVLLSGCFRPEVQVAEYTVPELSKPAAGAYLQNRIKALPGVVDTSYDLALHTITVSYESSTIREMNVEEAIALAGFAVNNRPANPTVKLPKGIK
jgi:hypothetical protein